MEFKTNGSNEFYGKYNNGSNDVIPVVKDGRIHGSQTFGHGNPPNYNVNPAGDYTDNGRNGDAPHREDIATARACAGTCQAWNDANANYVPSSTVAACSLAETAPDDLARPPARAATAPPGGPIPWRPCRR